jgi:hypothetical protein
MQRMSFILSSNIEYKNRYATYHFAAAAVLNSSAEGRGAILMATSALIPEVWVC